LICGRKIKMSEWWEQEWYQDLLADAALAEELFHWTELEEYFSKRIKS